MIPVSEQYLSKAPGKAMLPSSSMWYVCETVESVRLYLDSTESLRNENQKGMAGLCRFWCIMR